MAQVYKNIRLIDSAELSDPVASAPSPVVDQAALQAATAENSRLRAAKAEDDRNLQMALAEMAQMRTELAKLKATARDEGYKAGFDAGLAKAAKMIDEAVARVDGLLGSIAQQSRTPFADEEGAIVEIVLVALARVLGATLARREHAIEAVRQALGEYADRQVLTLHLSLEDHAYLAEAGVRFDGLPQLTVVASPKVDIGGCLIETSNGIVDARIETQLERIRAILVHTRETVARRGQQHAP